jgi:hypothetical protein
VAGVAADTVASRSVPRRQRRAADAGAPEPSARIARISPRRYLECACSGVHLPAVISNAATPPPRRRHAAAASPPRRRPVAAAARSMAFVPHPAGLSHSARHARPAACRAAPRMATGTHVGPDTEAGDYVTLGVAKVFRRTEGKLEDMLIVEPLPASALDCVARLKVPTSYLRLWTTRLGDVPDAISELPDTLVLAGESVAFADSFTERSQASARTYRRSPEIAGLLPLGVIFSDLNHSTERKRLVEDDWEPDFNDNVKQDKSIDVYNRADDNPDNAASADVKDLYNA